MGRKKLDRGRRSVNFPVTDAERIRMDQFVVMNQEALKSADVRPSAGIFARACAHWFMEHVKQLPKLKGHGKIEGRKK